MSEIALRTTERKLQTEECLHWRPVGSTIVCCCDSMIRRKWLEICCDLVSPKKRDKFKNIPGWQRLCDAWTPELRDAWLAYDRPTEQHKIGRLLMDKSYPQVVWKEMIEPIGVLKDLPFAPDADVKVHDTWLWSAEERKRYFIVVNNDANDNTVESWQGSEERTYSGGIARVWKKQIKYETDIGLSGDTLANIADVTKVLNPRFDLPVEAIKVIQPDIAEVTL